MEFIRVIKDNLEKEHIRCAIMQCSMMENRSRKSI